MNFIPKFSQSFSGLKAENFLVEFDQKKRGRSEERSISGRNALKCSQYNVKVFEIGIEDPETFLKFLEANRALLGQHLLSIHGEMTEEIYDFLESNSLHYVLNMTLPQAKRGVQRFRMLRSEEEEKALEERSTSAEHSSDTVAKEETPSLPKELAEVRDWLRKKRGKSPEKEAQKKETETSEEALSASDEEFPKAPPLKIVKQALRSGQSVRYDGSLLLTERINSGAQVAALGSVIALGPVEGNISSTGECVIVPPIRRGTLLFHGRTIENDALIHPLNKITFVDDQVVIQPINKKEFH